jgi:hypothetical protein
VYTVSGPTRQRVIVLLSHPIPLTSPVHGP